MHVGTGGDQGGHAALRDVPPADDQDPAPGEAQAGGIGREVAGAGVGCHPTIVRTPGAGEVSRAHPAD